MLTNAGLTKFAQTLAPLEYYIAVGSGDPTATNPAAAPEDTALVDEFVRQSFTQFTQVGPVLTGNVTVTLVGDKQIREFGVLVGATGGTLVERITVAEANGVDGDTLTIGWSLEVKRAS